MARGNAKARATLSRPAAQYTPWALHQWTERDLRREYTRLRDIAVKRLKRIGKEPGMQDAELDYWAGKVPKLSRMVDRLEIEDALSELSIFIANPEISTVGGIKERRRKQAAAWKKYTGSDRAPDVMTLREWWGYVQSEGLASVYASTEVVQYYHSTRGRRSKLTKDQFLQWLDRRSYWQERTAAGPESGSGGDTF